MDQRVSKATLPALREEFNEAFPELKGRVLAVSDAHIDKEHLPNLPICMMALLKATPNRDRNSIRKPAIDESFIIEFWYSPERYSQDGGESPFWAYYDYDTLQERVLTVTSNWISPRGSQLQFNSFSVEANQFAVSIAFRFTHTYFHCDYEPPPSCEEPDDGLPFRISYVLKAHPGDCCPHCDEPLTCEEHKCKSGQDDHKWKG